MKTQKIIIVIVVFLAVITLGWFAFTQSDSSTEYVIDESDFVDGTNLIENIPSSELTYDEIAGLTQMREEEKLARDVYSVLGQKWNLQILSNIAGSEQTHTDSVKVLLDRYEIDDPVADDAVGVFTSSVMADLYTNLVEQGDASALDALIVGATIEDLDIYDLSELLSETDNSDIITVYNNLQKGSRNHLRAFIAQIENTGGTYSPQYITQEEFNSIISTAQEKGQI
ncbi:MAG: DUF2202 domain-containing protein [Candidatus Bathyarchaeota archaeon]|nr:DUF2202 domain-containing protein [Candidatus Bathyarchaeum sp.]